MMLITFLIPLLFSSLLNVDAERDYSVCYKCVSNYVVYQWERVHLSSNLQYGDEITGDNNCLNASYPHKTVRCIGQCATFKVIANKNDKDYLFGALRDCSTSSAFKTLLPKINPITNSVELELRPVNSYERRAVFETCSGNYCNGNPSKKSSLSFSGSSKHNANLLLSLFLLIFTCLCIFV